MQDVDKTKAQLAQELAQAREHLADAQGRLQLLQAARQGEEEALRRSEHMLRLVMNTIPQFIFWKDRNSVYLGCNRNFAEAGGLASPEDIVGKSDYDLWKKEEADSFREYDQKIMDSDTPEYHIIEPLQQADGTQSWLDTNKVPLHDDDGNVVGILGTFVDITARKQAETDLQKSKVRFRDIVTNITDWVWEVDAQGHFTYSSEKITDLLGYSIADMLGKTPFDSMKPDEAARVGEIFANISAQKIPFENLENWHVTKHGREVCLLTSGSPIVDQDGNLIGYRGINRDITNLKLAEMERERQQQESLDMQQQAIQELSTPVIPIMDRILVMPLVGSIDSMRARHIMRALLEGIRTHRAKVIILDITGVPIVDSGVATHLDKTIQAARLKGARTILTGISDAVAEAIVDLGIDWSNLDTLSDLQTGLIVALDTLGIKLSKT